MASRVDGVACASGAGSAPRGSRGERDNKKEKLVVLCSMLARTLRRAPTTLLRRVAASSLRPTLARPAPMIPPQPLVRSLCWARTDDPHLDPVVPSPDRVLTAQIRGKEHYGQHNCRKLRKEGRTPCNLLGDRLPYVSLSVDTKELLNFIKRTHCQRELMTLRVEGGISPFEGEEVLVLPQEIQYSDLQGWKVDHVTFRRWPRDPERNPVKLSVPLVFVHQDAVPAIKAGSYVHEMFETGQGLRCWVRQREHIPRFLLADMRRAVNGDLRYEHLDMPPGVTPRKCAPATIPHSSRRPPPAPCTRMQCSPTERTSVTAVHRYKAGRTDGNFLVGRVTRVRG